MNLHARWLRFSHRREYNQAQVYSAFFVEYTSVCCSGGGLFAALLTLTGYERDLTISSPFAAAGSRLHLGILEFMGKQLQDWKECHHRPGAENLDRVLDGTGVVLVRSIDPSGCGWGSRHACATTNTLHECETQVNDLEFHTDLERSNHRRVSGDWSDERKEKGLREANILYSETTRARILPPLTPLGSLKNGRRYLKSGLPAGLHDPRCKGIHRRIQTFCRRSA